MAVASVANSASAADSGTGSGWAAALPAADGGAVCTGASLPGVPETSSRSTGNRMPHREHRTFWPLTKIETSCSVWQLGQRCLAISRSPRGPGGWAPGGPCP